MRGRIFSIGHGGRSLDGMIAQLRALEIRFLIDVRSVPYSRFQPEFSRTSLRAGLERDQIRYVYLGDLLGGRPDDPECYGADGRVDYPRCRTRPGFLQGIERLRTAFHKGLRVCLLCSEGQPGWCHRTRLVGASLQDHGITVEHVLPDGDVRMQDQVVAGLTGGQGELFGGGAGVEE
jgi:uncharacterized protein (DUF488 family)